MSQSEEWEVCLIFFVTPPPPPPLPPPSLNPTSLLRRFETFDQKRKERRKKKKPRRSLFSILSGFSSSAGANDTHSRFSCTRARHVFCWGGLQMFRTTLLLFVSPPPSVWMECLGEVRSRRETGEMGCLEAEEKVKLMSSARCIISRSGKEKKKVYLS